MLPILNIYCVQQTLWQWSAGVCLFSPGHEWMDNEIHFHFLRMSDLFWFLQVLLAPSFSLIYFCFDQLLFCFQWCSVWWQAESNWAESDIWLDRVSVVHLNSPKYTQHSWYVLVSIMASSHYLFISRSTQTQSRAGGGM